MRDEARHDEEADRVDGERAERVDLLGDDHRAELGGVVRADAARDHERREQRARSRAACRSRRPSRASPCAPKRFDDRRGLDDHDARR